MIGALAMKTAKKPRSKEITLKYHYKHKGEPVEKILREAVVQHIRSEVVKNGWSQILGGTTCIQK
jgi:hypothetical protein